MKLLDTALRLHTLPSSITNKPNKPNPVTNTLSKLAVHKPPLFRFSRTSKKSDRGNDFGQEFRRIQSLVPYKWNSQVNDNARKYYIATRELMMAPNDMHAPNKSLAMINSIRKHCIVDSAATGNGLLKLLLLFGYLTLQDPQLAFAGMDVTSALQSVPFLGDFGDIGTGFASAFLLIFFSELGDKTFFIAALLAARNSAAVTFLGTFGALAVMTVISVVLGRTFHYVDEILPFRFGGEDLPVDDIAAVCLLVYFGVSTLLDAASSDGLKADDEQKEAELAVSELSGNGAGILSAANTIISTFVLVFVAEWGDKSFFSTIALAAASSPLGVICGAVAGHGVATLIAVLGGTLLGTFLSEKAVAYIGGTLFLVFAAVTLFEIVN